MATKLTDDQLEHVRQTTRKMLSYLFRVKEDLEAKGHDERHSYYRQVVSTWQSVVALSDATSWVMVGGPGFALAGGSLREGPIPPNTAELEALVRKGMCG